MKNAAIIACLIYLLAFDVLSAQTRLAIKSWTPVAAKTAMTFPILAINKKSNWTLTIRSKEEKNIVTFYDTVRVTNADGSVTSIKKTIKYDVNGATLSLRNVLRQMGLAKLPAIDEGLVSIQLALDSNNQTTHWLLIENARALLWIGPIVKKGKYIRAELALRFLPEPLKLDQAMVQNMDGSVMFQRGQELKILSGSGRESDLETDGMVTIMNRQMMPMVSGDTSWLVWTDKGPKRFGRHVSDLIKHDEVAGKMYFDGSAVRVLWPNGDFVSHDLGVGKHQLDLRDKKIGKASIREVMDFGVSKAVIWYDSNNRIITPPADSVYQFKLTDSWLYSAKREQVLGLVDPAGSFHALPIAGYGQLVDARMTDLATIAEEDPDSLVQVDIEESEDLAVVEYETDGKIDSAYVWPKHRKLTPYWGKPIYARDSLYLFQSITGPVEILRPDNDFSRLRTRYQIIKGRLADTNIYDFKPTKVGKLEVVKLGFRRDLPAMENPVGFDWLWTKSGRITYDLGTFVGYAQLIGYKDSSVYVFLASGRISLLFTEDWSIESFHLNDLPEYIDKSEFIVTVWTSLRGPESKAVVKARIVADKGRSNSGFFYDQERELPLLNH